MDLRVGTPTLQGLAAAPNMGLGISVEEARPLDVVRAPSVSARPLPRVRKQAWWRCCALLEKGSQGGAAWGHRARVHPARRAPHFWWLNFFPITPSEPWLAALSVAS